jgi:hypothetical protein
VEAIETEEAWSGSYRDQGGLGKGLGWGVGEQKNCVRLRCKVRNLTGKDGKMKGWREQTRNLERAGEKVLGIGRACVRSLAEDWRCSSSDRAPALQV